MSTHALLRRIADAEARAHARFAGGNEVRRFGPIVAISASTEADTPLPTDTGWLGGDLAPAAADLSEFEAFSAEQRQPATLHLLSHQLPATLPRLTERGYDLDYGLHLHVHDLHVLPSPPALPVREETVPARWAILAAQGFGPGTEGVMRQVARAARTQLFVAQLDGQDAATGAMALQDAVAALHGTATLPQFRGRGAQAALLAQRLRVATEQGADLATVFVTPGSGSERNAERAGFRPAGMRLTFTRR